jgi:hypothetical protein
MAIPAFNIPFPPMMEAVVEALPDIDCFGPIAVARPEWMKFEAQSVRAIYQEYQWVKDERFTRLHLDHLPVIDEDNLSVDYEAIIQEAIQLCHCADLKASAKRRCELIRRRAPLLLTLHPAPAGRVHESASKGVAAVRLPRRY